MRVSILFPTLLGYGGSPKVAVNISKELAHLGCDVQLVAYHYDPKLYDPLVKGISGLTITAYKQDVALPKNSNNISSRFPLIRDYFAGSGKFAEVIDPKADVIFPMEALVYFAALKARRRNRHAKIAWFIHDPPQYAFKEQIGILYNRSAIYKLGLNLFSVFEKAMVKKLDYVCVPSLIAKKGVDTAFGLESVVLRIGGVDVMGLKSIEFSKGLTKQKLGLSSESILLGSVGVYFPHRRFEDAIAAVSLLRRMGHDVHYLIAGSDETNPEYGRYLTHLVEHLGLSKYVHFYNRWMSESEVLSIYHDSDIFVFPNDTQTWGLSPLEAMAIGRPVLLTTGAGVSEVLDNGRTAIVVPPRSPEKMAESIAECITNRQLREQIAENGQRFVLEEWTYQRCARKLLNFFETIIGSQ